MCEGFIKGSAHREAYEARVQSGIFRPCLLPNWPTLQSYQAASWSGGDRVIQRLRLESRLNPDESPSEGLRASFLSLIWGERQAPDGRDHTRVHTPSGLPIRMLKREGCGEARSAA